MKTFNQYITEKIRLSNDRFRNQHNGFEYVDLGLPSGTLWATCNLGAKTETGYGDYFAWGETELKKEYTWENYKFSEGYNLTKYNGNDKLIELELEDDAAHVNMGSKWHIPTEEQFEELMNNTTGSWESNYNGTAISGLVLTGKNKKQLFLPVVGYKDNDKTFKMDFAGYYWISELDTNTSSDSCKAFVVRKDKNKLFITINERYHGNCIRPVLKK